MMPQKLLSSVFYAFLAISRATRTFAARVSSAFVHPIKFAYSDARARESLQHYYRVARVVR